MVEPLTAVGTGLVILGSKDILNKLLGPTADYVGEEARNLITKCNVNLDNVFVRAKEKLGRKIDEPGAVNPRILKNIMDEARFCENTLATEYYAGILATARDKSGGNDEGIQHIATIRDLSSLQLKIHYMFYHSLKKTKNFEGQNLNLEAARRGLSMYFPMSELMDILEFSDESEAFNKLASSLHGLIRSGLIGSYYRFGQKEHMLKDYSEAKESGVIIEPTAYGAELLLWVEGIKEYSAGCLLFSEISFDKPIIRLPEGAVPRTPVVHTE